MNDEEKTNDDERRQVLLSFGLDGEATSRETAIPAEAERRTRIEERKKGIRGHVGFRTNVRRS